MKSYRYLLCLAFLQYTLTSADADEDFVNSSDSDFKLIDHVEADLASVLFQEASSRGEANASNADTTVKKGLVTSEERQLDERIKEIAHRMMDTEREKRKDKERAHTLGTDTDAGHNAAVGLVTSEERQLDERIKEIAHRMMDTEREKRKDKERAHTLGTDTDAGHNAAGSTADEFQNPIMDLDVPISRSKVSIDKPVKEKPGVISDDINIIDKDGTENAEEVLVESDHELVVVDDAHMKPHSTKDKYTSVNHKSKSSSKHPAKQDKIITSKEHDAYSVELIEEDGADVDKVDAHLGSVKQVEVEAEDEAEANSERYNEDDNGYEDERKEDSGDAAAEERKPFENMDYVKEEIDDFEMVSNSIPVVESIEKEVEHKDTDYIKADDYVKNNEEDSVEGVDKENVSPNSVQEEEFNSHESDVKQVKGIDLYLDTDENGDGHSEIKQGGVDDFEKLADDDMKIDIGTSGQIQIDIDIFPVEFEGHNAQVNDMMVEEKQSQGGDKDGVGEDVVSMYILMGAGFITSISLLALQQRIRRRSAHSRHHNFVDLEMGYGRKRYFSQGR
eukprot:CFRG2944T1